MSGLPVEETFRLVDELRAESERLHQRESLLIGSLLAGNRGATLLGKRVEFELHWPDGLPFGWTEEQLQSYGAEMFVKAGGDPSAVEAANGCEGNPHCRDHPDRQGKEHCGTVEAGNWCVYCHRRPA